MKTVPSRMTPLKTSVGKHPPVTLITILILLLAALAYLPAEAAPVAVRFPEGVIHGFLSMRSPAGEIIGQGEMTQVAKEEGVVEGHLVIRFKDGSLHDEKVVFSQQRVFTMIRYALVQSGPAFPRQVDVWIDRRTTEYKVRSSEGKSGKEEVLTGRLDLPKDIYNGMLALVLKNLLNSANETVSYLVFTPSPQVIKVKVTLMGEQTVQTGELSDKARKYALQPQIGMIQHLYGKLLGKLPAIFHYYCWILADDVPGFVQFEGPLQLMGSIMRIELLSPRLPAKAEDKNIPKKK